MGKISAVGSSAKHEDGPLAPSPRCNSCSGSINKQTNETGPGEARSGFSAKLFSANRRLHAEPSEGGVGQER